MLSFQMVAAEQYFLVKLFILLYKPEVLLTLEFVDDILWCYREMKATKQYFRVVNRYMYCSLCEVNKNLINILILCKSL